MTIYNSIPANIKPLVGSSRLHYADDFESEFSLLLREIKSTNIPTMLKYSLEVEANLMASGKMKQRMEVDRRKNIEENQSSTSASSSNDAKFEMVINTMERLMGRLDLDNKPSNREKFEPQIRNQNCRRPPPTPPQIR